MSEELRFFDGINCVGGERDPKHQDAGYVPSTYIGAADENSIWNQMIGDQRRWGRRTGRRPFYSTEKNDCAFLSRIISRV